MHILKQNHLLKFICVINLLFVLLAIPVASVDVPDSWALEEINLATELNLIPRDMRGCYTQDITRVEFCRLAVTCLNKVAKANNWVLSPTKNMVFNDTEDKAVLTAAGLGIVSGNGAGSFLPDKGITRQEAAVMLYNTMKLIQEYTIEKELHFGITSTGEVEALEPNAGHAQTSFADQIRIAAWAEKPVSAIVDWGIMSGTGGGAFSPLGAYSRQQAYVTMYRLYCRAYLSMSSYNITLQPGESTSLTCDCTSPTAILTWSSSNSSIITVNGNEREAILTAGESGSASVICRSGNVMVKSNIIVKPVTVTTEYDFKGAARMHYSNDVAWDLCRQLEDQIGAQIFYLPEFDDNIVDNMITHETYSYSVLNNIYFQHVYQELYKMKQAIDLYPEGFLREVISKKSTHKTEIVLYPDDSVYGGKPLGFGYDSGYLGHFAYAYSGPKTDRIYLSGSGDVDYYCHEIGHAVLSAAMIANGWTVSRDYWISLTENSGMEGFVSSYAMTRYSEDFAETWTYLWLHRNQVDHKLATGQSECLRAKIAFLTEVITKHYKTATMENLPWNYMLK